MRISILSAFVLFIAAPAMADSEAGVCRHQPGAQFNDQINLPKICHEKDVLGPFASDLEHYLAQHKDPGKPVYWRDRRLYLTNHMLGKHPAAIKPDRERLRSCLKAVHALGCSPQISKAAQDFLFAIGEDDLRPAAGPRPSLDEAWDTLSATGAK